MFCVLAGARGRFGITVEIRRFHQLLGGEGVGVVVGEMAIYRQLTGEEICLWISEPWYLTILQ